MFELDIKIIYYEIIYAIFITGYMHFTQIYIK